MAAYCSRECQVRHWKNPLGPHKAECRAQDVFQTGDLVLITLPATVETEAGGGNSARMITYTGRLHGLGIPVNREPGSTMTETWDVNFGGGKIVSNMPSNMLKRLPPSVPPPPTTQTAA